MKNNEKQEKETIKREMVERHDTWLALNPVLGCPNDCGYCFLKPEGLTSVKQNFSEKSFDEILKEFVDYEYYSENTPVAIGTHTDMFATQKSREYLLKFLNAYNEQKIPNDIVLMTKKEIPDNFIEEITNYKKDGLNFIFYISYSGLSKKIEPNINIEKLRNNFVKLNKAGFPIVHYWRPFMPENSSSEKMDDIFNFVSQYAKTSVVTGLKFNEEMLDNFDFWPEIKEEPLYNELKSNYKKIEGIWPIDSLKNLFRYRKQINDQEKDYAIFTSNACALAYTQGRAETTGFYGSKICSSNACPLEQRRLCSKFNSSNTLKEKDINDLMQKLEIKGKANYENGNVVIQSLQTIPREKILMMQEDLQCKVVSSSNLSGKYWGSSFESNPKVIYKSKKELTKNIFSKSQELRSRFEEIEPRPWNKDILSLELLVQLGHLIELVSKKAENWNEKNPDGTPRIHNIGDELADILFMVSALAKYEKIDPDDFAITEEKDDAQSLLKKIIIEVGNKEKNLTKIWSLVFSFAKQKNINLFKEFDLMYQDANNFLDSDLAKKLNKNEENFKEDEIFDKIILAYSLTFKPGFKKAIQDLIDSFDFNNIVTIDSGNLENWEIASILGQIAESVMKRNGFRINLDRKDGENEEVFLKSRLSILQDYINKSKCI